MSDSAKDIVQHCSDCYHQADYDNGCRCFIKPTKNEKLRTCRSQKWGKNCKDYEYRGRASDE